MKEYIGIGLRSQHLIEFLKTKPHIGWVEVHTENFISRGGIDYDILQKIRQNYPISLHGIGMSLGSTTPLDPDHLAMVKDIYDEIRPFKISEHLSWSKAEGHFLPDLIPFPFTEEALKTFSRNIEQVQNTLGTKLLIENPSSYFSYVDSNISEPEFLNRICGLTGCGILLDVSNIYLSGHNNKFDPKEYIDQVEAKYIEETHIAGFSKRIVDDENYLLIDSHDDVVHDEVWRLYNYVLQKTGPVHCLLEWDANLPPLEQLLEEAAKMEGYLEKCEAAQYV